jgi:hypothetical protein
MDENLKQGNGKGLAFEGFSIGDGITPTPVVLTCYLP